MNKKLTDIELHSAGATVRHKSPFSELESYTNAKAITQEFREKWVIPFYFELGNQSDEWINKMILLKPKITGEIILQNLGDFDWRPRSTGSYFASIMQLKHLEDIIGVHLLKSEVCRAGAQYAVTIASFNTEKSADYFNKYLDYYLKKPELYFDQEAVLTALKYLDEVNGTRNIDNHLENYESYLNWRNKAKISKLENLKKLIPGKADDIDKQIEELEPDDGLIDTTYFAESIASLNRIINEH